MGASIFMHANFRNLMSSSQPTRDRAYRATSLSSQSVPTYLTGTTRQGDGGFGGPKEGAQFVRNAPYLSRWVQIIVTGVRESTETRESLGTSSG